VLSEESSFLVIGRQSFQIEVDLAELAEDARVSKIFTLKREEIKGGIGFSPESNALKCI
jgi:hypothetical protein